METFLGTLLIVILCCLAMGIGLLLSGRPLAGGCGSKPPGSPRCAGCPRRDSRVEEEAGGKARQ
jgi:hypothetical protein